MALLHNKNVYAYLGVMLLSVLNSSQILSLILTLKSFLIHECRRSGFANLDTVVCCLYLTITIFSLKYMQILYYQKFLLNAVIFLSKISILELYIVQTLNLILIYPFRNT